MKKRKKKSKKDYIILIIFFICLITFIISIVNVLLWIKDSNNTDEEIQKINEQVVFEEVTNNIETKIINPPQEEDKKNPYWDYIKTNLLKVDFSKLKSTNKDVKGWIQISGTNINYPFVQSYNNSYYLTHSFDKSYNKAGWVFLDYRNNINGSDDNTIIYAHGRLDKTMFGSLKNLLTNNWYQNINNHTIKLSTEAENTLWQVFSVYHIPTTSDYLQINYDNDTEYQAFLDMLQDRSQFEFNTALNAEDRILTLSTCYNENEKVVMHAKLIKSDN